MEKHKKKPNLLPHGAGRRIASLTGISAKTVSLALHGYPGISQDTQLRVAKAARTVMRHMASEQRQFAKRLAALRP